MTYCDEDSPCSLPMIFFRRLPTPPMDDARNAPSFGRARTSHGRAHWRRVDNCAQRPRDPAFYSTVWLKSGTVTHLMVRNAATTAHLQLSRPNGRWAIG